MNPSAASGPRTPPSTTTLDRWTTSCATISSPRRRGRRTAWRIFRISSPERQASNKRQTGDRLYVVGYPYDNSSEMEQVMELWNNTRDPYSCSTATSIPFEAASRPGARRRSSSTSSCPKVGVLRTQVRRGTATGAAVPRVPRTVARVPRCRRGHGVRREYDERPELRTSPCSSSPAVSCHQSRRLRRRSRGALLGQHALLQLLGVVRDCDRKAINAAYREALRRDTRTSAATPWIFTNSAKPSRC